MAGSRAAPETSLAIFGWVAEQEKPRLSERTRAGLARARREGKRIGRPRRIAAVDLPRLVKLRREGLSLRQIAQRLRVPETFRAPGPLAREHVACESKRVGKPGLGKPRLFCTVWGCVETDPILRSDLR